MSNTTRDISTSSFSDRKDQQDVIDTIFEELERIRASAFLTGLLTGSDTWDAGEIADGDEAVKEITVTDAALGDFVLVSASIDVADLSLVGQVTEAGKVTVQLLNNTGGAINLDSMTVRVLVIPASIENVNAMQLTK